MSNPKLHRERPRPERATARRPGLQARYFDWLIKVRPEGAPADFRCPAAGDFSSRIVWNFPFPGVNARAYGLDILTCVAPWTAGTRHRFVAGGDLSPWFAGAPTHLLSKLRPPKAATSRAQSKEGFAFIPCVNARAMRCWPFRPSTQT